MHLELVEDYSTIEFLQTLRRFFAIRGQPTLMTSDDGTQLVGAEREMVRGWNEQELKEFSAEKGMEWKFITHRTALHHNGCAEAMVKTAKKALKTAIGEQILKPFELYTCLLDRGAPEPIL